MENTPILSFSQKLELMGFRSYDEYLRSEIWKKFRKKYFRSKKRKYCMLCRKPNFDVELHHKSYDRLGTEKLTDVVPLCREHHEEVHRLLLSYYNDKVEYTLTIIAALRASCTRRTRVRKRRRYRRLDPSSE